MSEPHPLGILAPHPGQIEAVSPEFLVDGLWQARTKTLDVFEEIRSRLREGMTEDDARRLALEVFVERGVSKHWHKPYIRFGAGTTMTFHEPLQEGYRLKQGDACYIDLGPVWKCAGSELEYEGDFGDSFVFGENSEVSRCAESARQIFRDAKARWQNGGLTGAELYRFLEERATKLGYRLVAGVDGHRVGDFPHHRYSKERLAQLPFVPKESLWVLEVQINDPQARFGAFFEDIL